MKQRIDKSRSRIEKIKTELDEIKEISKVSNSEARKKIDRRIKNDKKLNHIRQECFYELIKYLFPIQRVSAEEE